MTSEKFIHEKKKEKKKNIDFFNIFFFFKIFNFSTHFLQYYAFAEPHFHESIFQKSYRYIVRQQVSSHIGNLGM